MAVRLRLVGWLAAWAFLAVLSAACGSAASQTQSAPTEAAGPPPAPTVAPAETPTATQVPTDTPPPTSTAVPSTPTPVPPPPTPTPKPGSPAYVSNPWDRSLALRSYHLALSVTADNYQYSVVGDFAGRNYHVVLSQPLQNPAEVFDVGGHYVTGAAGSYVDTGTTAPPPIAILDAAQAFARSWFDHPDSAVFKNREVVNGVPSNHYVVTWKAGRPLTLGAISAVTYDPTTGDVWLDEATGAVVKAVFNVRVSSGGAVSEIATHVDLSAINRPVTIALPPAQKPAA